MATRGEHSGEGGVSRAMDDGLQGYEDDDRWVVLAAHVEPLVLPEPPRRRAKPRNKEACRALALAILGILGFGLVASPLALALGQRARLALVAEPDQRDAGMARAAVTIGKVGLALHIAFVASALPWLLFVLPLLRSAGR
jgi:hypothetical protein